MRTEKALTGTRGERQRHHEFQRFKNMTIAFTDLPKAPKLPNVRKRKRISNAEVGEATRPGSVKLRIGPSGSIQEQGVTVDTAKNTFTGPFDFPDKFWDSITDTPFFYPDAVSEINRDDLASNIASSSIVMGSEPVQFRSNLSEVDLADGPPYLTVFDLPECNQPNHFPTVGSIAYDDYLRSFAYSRNKGRHGSLDPKQKQAAAASRKLRSCLRCKVLKTRVIIPLTSVSRRLRI